MRQDHLDILRELQAMAACGTLRGCYADIPIDVYHHPECPGYSSTTIKRIIQRSYNHWYIARDENRQPLRFGNAFHCYVDDPELFRQLYQVAPTDRRNSAEWSAAKITAGEKILLTFNEFESIKVMSQKLYEHPDASPLLKDARSELSYFSVDQVTGLIKKCRVDAIKGRALSDLKSTLDASSTSFSWDSKKYLYRISAAYYLEIVSEVTGLRHNDFHLIACEKEEPFEIKVYRVSDASIEKAQEEIRQALQTIRTILVNGPSAWKGYQLGVEDIHI